MLKGENTHLSNRDGLKQLGDVLKNQMPLDLVIIFLGTNDAQYGVNKTAAEIADSLDDYFEVIDSICKKLSASKPRVLIVSPPKIREQFLKGETEAIFVNSASLIDELPKPYKQKAVAHNAHFFDASKVAEGSPEDGVHLDADALGHDR